MKDPGAVRYARVAYEDALRLRLGVMDATAFSLCMDNRIPIVVFNLAQPDILRRIIAGDLTAATLVSSGATLVSDQVARP